MAFHRARQLIAWLHLPVALCLTDFLVYAQTPSISEFHTVSEWKGAWRQKPLRQYLPLTGGWAIAGEKMSRQLTIALPALLPANGTFTCRREFYVDAALADRPLRFVAGAINYRCQVSVNDMPLGFHEGGFTPFALDIKRQQLLPGRNNTLQLVVDTGLQPLTTIPARLRPQAGRHTPGIFENLFIEVLPDLAIDSLRWGSEPEADGAAARVHVSFVLRIRENFSSAFGSGSLSYSGGRGEGTGAIAGAGANHRGDDVRVVAELFDSTRTERLAAAQPLPVERFDRARQHFNMEFRLDDARWWAPVTPHLYALRLAVTHGQTVVDEWWETVGLRRLHWQRNGLVVNGQPTFLRGIDWVVSAADSARCADVAQRVRDWGGNLLRVVGQPAPAPLLDACDRQGIFVLEEIPVYHFTPAHLAQIRFFEVAAGQLREMIVRDRNHPSVLAWGLATSTLLPDTATNIFLQLRDVAMQLDDRPVYAVAELALARHWWRVADFFVLDSFEREVAADVAALPVTEKPLLSRLGFSLVSGGSTTEEGPADRAMQQHQAHQLQSALQGLRANRDRLAGYVVAALEDWRVQAPLLRAGNQNDPTLYRAGLRSASGQTRLAFHVTQAMNGEASEPTVLPADAPISHPEVYPIVGIGLIVLVIFSINRDRRLRGNLRRIFAHPHGFYVDIVEHRKVSPALTMFLAFAEGCIIAVLLSSFLFAYRQSFVLDNMLTLTTGGAALKASLVWLIWHPGWFIVAGTIAHLLLSVALATLMRLMAFLFGRRLRLPQLLTFVFWAAANVLVLGIIAPFFYRLLVSGRFLQPLLFVVAVVAVWLLLRLFRGMKVIFTVNTFKALFLFALVFGGIGLSIYLYYDRTQAVWDYAAYYWSLLASR